VDLTYDINNEKVYDFGHIIYKKIKESGIITLVNMTIV